MKFGVVLFPGSNCDRDMLHVCSQVLGAETIEIWHKETQLPNFSQDDCVILPGGFSYGDYLRTGAIARFSPIMDAVIEFANAGGNVLGICNGFQILCESGLLPGVLLRNKQQTFVCENKFLSVENTESAFTRLATKKQVLKIPVAHADGRFYCDDQTLQELKKNEQILFKYCLPNGDINEEANFNGSIDNIAGIMNEKGNVFGMMPHPERGSESELLNTDGLILLKGLMNNNHNVSNS